MLVYLLILAAVVCIYVVAKLPGGCSGDCRQGRLPCKCNRNNE